MWTSSITLLEIQFGLEIMPVGKRRTLLMQGFAALLDEIGDRVASFDAAAAQEASYVMAARHKKGRPGDLRDTMIAGIVLAHHATLATRNIAHFEDIPNIVNPWTA